MRITLYNDFHDRFVVLNSSDGKLSKRQVTRARKTLCGAHDCICSGPLGTRGKQIFHIDVMPDGTGVVRAVILDNIQ